MLLQLINFVNDKITKKYQCFEVILYLTLILLLQFEVNAQTDTIRSNPVEILRNDINALIANPDFVNANIGICVQAIESGEYIYLNNDSKTFIPASTQKVITTAAALELLGENFKFTTKVYLDGKLSADGEFVGNIIIRGLGDPSISKYFYKSPIDILESWVKTIDESGINSIKGNIIGDDTYFDGSYYGPGWSWDDFSYYYSSQVSALSINDNRIDFFIYSGDSLGDVSRITPYPLTSYYRLVNNVRTSEPSSQSNITSIRDMNTNIIKLSGTVPFEISRKTSYPYSSTIDNPAMFFLDLFKSKLDEKKISFSGGMILKSDMHEFIDYATLTPLIEFYSPPLSEIISIINQESHNLAAEMLFKTIGKENSGVGSFYSGSEYVLKYLTKAGVNTQNVRIYDGSGLSRLNLISPRNMVNVLNYIYRSPYKDIFIQSLAKPGEPGTLKRRMTRSKAEKSVFAKTGGMNYVSAICGYVNTSDNETFAFSIMMQNFTVPGTLATNLQDLILMRMSSFSRK